MSLLGLRYDMKVVPLSTTKSCINFISSNGNTAFCFNPQVDDNSITCNTIENGTKRSVQSTPGNGVFTVGKPTLVFIDFRTDGFFPVCGDDSSVSIRFQHQMDANSVTNLNFEHFNIESLTISKIPQ